MNNKKEYGQFMTTNYKYILQNLNIPEYIENIIEPFCGNGDLLNFFDKDKYKYECYDIDPKKEFIEKRDTLLNPPDYKNKFVITNPPYLARNRSTNKEIFEKYKVNDLYKCFIKEIINNSPNGGILIIPLNFWSSIRKTDIELRKYFLERFDIIYLNIFEEQVFDDTTYTICSFQFKIKNNLNNNEFDITIYPYEINIKTELNHNNNYIIGGEIYNLKLKDKYKVYRLTKENIKNKNTNILVKCIDDNDKNKINMTIVSDNNIYIDNSPKLSSRTYLTLIIEPEIKIEKQKILCIKFNEMLNNYRNKYNSLFLTNYRESTDIARKRISFDLVYKISQYILENYIFVDLET